MDVGASTGGFTDCLLQHGAEKVIAVDVGYGQLHQRLREDPRVVVVERTNARYLTAQDLPGIIHGATIDVSFISVTLLARPVSSLLEDKAFVIVLVKPQFEVGRAKVKKGVVKDPSLHQEAVEKVKESFLALGWEEIGVIPSPILGPKGNKEFLLGLKR
jgi:23S rRNA (cytidine1920-2'-O)/16S rRNA (cytidine1409-2'-O)-methyltransferase